MQLITTWFSAIYLRTTLERLGSAECTHSGYGHQVVCLVTVLFQPVAEVCLRNGDMQVANACDMSMHLVALYDWADTRRCPGKNDIAWL